MLRRLACAALLAAAVAATDAQASCGGTITFEGRELYPVRVVDPRQLPPTGESLPARRCGTSGDFGIGVYRFTGMPPELAVLSEDRRRVYKAVDTVPAMAGHPLQAALYGTRPPRRPSGCRPRPGFRRATVLGQGGTVVRARVGGRQRRIEIDAGSRITNGPAYTPIRARQRLDVRLSACGTRRFADRIVLRGPVPDGRPPPGGGVAIDGSDPGGDDGASPYLIPAVLLGAGVLFVGAVGLGLLRPTARRRRPR